MSNTVSLVQISDCHIDDVENCMGSNTHESLNNIIKEVALIDADALLISGDLSHNGTKNSYQIIRQILNPIKTNLLILSGNHDNKENLNSAFAEHLLEKTTLGAWDIIATDSVQVNKTSGFLTTSELEKLDTSLSTSTAQHILLTLHHPIVPMQSNWDDALSLKNPQDLFAVLSKHSKIKAVIFGHAHQAKTFNKDGIKIFSCPSTALQFDQETRVGFNHYTLHNNGQLDCTTQWL